MRGAHTYEGGGVHLLPNTHLLMFLFGDIQISNPMWRRIKYIAIVNCGVINERNMKNGFALQGILLILKKIVNFFLCKLTTPRAKLNIFCSSCIMTNILTTIDRLGWMVVDRLMNAISQAHWIKYDSYGHFRQDSKKKVKWNREFLFVKSF
jgi:hypothetical protein